MLAEAWDFIGPLFDTVFTQGQPISTLTHQLFTFHRKNYLEECYFAFSYSPIPDDDGHVGGVLTNALDMTERVIEDRRRQVLRELASRTAEARHEEEVWRVSAETLGQNRSSAPFAFLYEYLPGEQKACLASISADTDEALHPAVIDCNSESIWRFNAALAEDCLVVALLERASGLSIPGWPSPPREATVLPIRLRERSEAAGFLVLGLHPGREFDDTYRHFVRRIAEQIAIGLASARAYEQERRRAEALAEIDRAKTAFFSNVSHEFRTPLTLMLGPLEEVLPEAREQLSPQRHEQLVTVRRNAFRLLKLVNTLLDFSRIEAGRVQAAYEPLDLASVTSGIASVFRSAMENAGLRFSVECPPLAEPVYVDRDMWEKVVSNLLSNAFKFTFEGAVTVTSETGRRRCRIAGPRYRRRNSRGPAHAGVRALSSDRGHAGPDVRRHGDRTGARSRTGQAARRPCASRERSRSRQHVHRDDSVRHGAFAGGAHPGRAIGRVDGNWSRRICRGGTAVVAGRLERGRRRDASQSRVARTVAVTGSGGEARTDRRGR